MKVRGDHRGRGGVLPAAEAGGGGGERGEPVRGGTPVERREDAEGKEGRRKDTLYYRSSYPKGEEEGRRRVAVKRQSPERSIANERRTDGYKVDG